MLRVTSQWKREQNYMNWTLNCFRIHRLDLALSDFFLFSDLKRMLAEKKFSADEEVIAETEVYFEAKDKSYIKNGKIVWAL